MTSCNLSLLRVLVINIMMSFSSCYCNQFSCLFVFFFLFFFILF